MRDLLDAPLLNLRGANLRRAANFRWPLILALGFCLLALLLLHLDRRGLFKQSREFLDQGLITPALKNLGGLHNAMADLGPNLQSNSSLRAENERLKQQVSQLQAEVLLREQALVENARLRQQLALAAKSNWNLLGAEVMVRSADAGRRGISINCGSAEGVAPGMAVLGQTGSEPTALVGIVAEVGPHTARVLLITDLSSQISARVLHEGTATLGLVQGQWQRGSRLRLEQLEQEITLVVGSAVVSAGLTSELNLALPLAAVPGGIPIGRIEKLGSNGHTQVAELWPYVDPDQVRYVWVILSLKG